MKKVSIASWNEIEDRKPAYALLANVDLVIVRYEDKVSVMYGRCAHRGALMADGTIVGDNIICGVHGWDYLFETGVSEYNNSERLHKFSAWLEDDSVWVDKEEIVAWKKENPQPYKRDSYQGLYQDPGGTPDEPHVKFIRSLASDGLSKLGHHGPMGAMGASRRKLPSWDDIQFNVAQLAEMYVVKPFWTNHLLV